MSNRIGVDEYFLKIAIATAERSTCDRAHVGAVIVREGHILSTGYNGSLPHYPHCDNVETCCFNGRCIRTTHAELNAIKRAMQNDQDLEFSTLYSTHRPCFACIQAAAAFGIRRIVFDKIYDDPRTEAYAKLVGLELIQVELDG